MKKTLIMLSLIFTQFATKATNYYFSDVTGDDTRTSSQAQNPATPWKSITKLNSVFSSIAAGDSILFKRGETFYGSITVGKTGTSGSPIIIGAYGSGAKPIITGFTAVASWNSIGSYLWESATAVTALSTVNIVSIGGVNYAMGRSPDAGYWTILYTNGTTTITDASHLNASVTNWTGGEVVVRELMYEVNKHTISAASGGTITFGAGSITANWGYFIQNHVSACNLQNEWGYNISTKKMFIYSSTTPAAVKVPTVDEGVNLNGKDYITFVNLDFQGFNSTGINTNSRTGIKIQNCDFSFIGVNGVYAYPNSGSLRVTGSTFTDCGSRGIFGGSSSSAVFSNNTLLRIGHYAGQGSNGDDSYTGIVCNGDNSEVSYNSITDAGYCGIRWDGNSTVIKGNFVNHATYIKDDGGGIYCYPVQFGNTPHNQTTRTLRDNIVINCTGAPNGSPYGNEGYFFYFDGQSPNINCINNTGGNSSGSAKGGIFVNGGHDIFIDSNTIFNARYALLLKKIGGPITNETVTNNIFISAANNNGVSCGSGYYAAVYYFGASGIPASFTANNNVYANPLDQTRPWIFVENNGVNNCYTLAQWKTASSREGSSTASPFIVASLASLRFDYNKTNSDVSVTLDGTYTDLKNNSYIGFTSLTPYGSLVSTRTGDRLRQWRSSVRIRNRY